MPNPTGFPQVDTEKVVEILIDDMLQKFHGKNPDLDRRIEDAWRRRHGVPFRKFRPNPVALYGLPGHGKTASFRDAARRVAEMLDMRLVVDPSDVLLDGPEGRSVYRPGPDDLLFITMDNANKKSAIDFGGIPTKKQIDGREYMTKLLQYRLAILNDAAAGVLLLDDLMNADKAFQDACMPIIDEGRYDALSIPHVLVGITGNLGSLDGTNAGRPSTAMRSRARNFYVEDTPVRFIERIQRYYDDDLADAGVSGLIRYDPSLLYGTAEQPHEAFSCPRSLTRLINDLRRLRHLYGNDPARFVEEVQLIAESLVGREAAHKIAAYYHMLANSSWPIADALIETGRLPPELEETFEKHRGDGHSAEAQQFEYQLAIAGADIVAAKAFQENRSFNRTMRHYGKLLNRLSDTHLSVSTIHLLDNLENRGFLRDEDGNSNLQIKKRIVKVIVASFREEGGEDRADVLIDALSAYLRHGAKPDDYLKIPGVG